MKPASLAPEPTGSGRLCLDMAISDFGPIKRADISLRPLTVFIGGNDTGKSYAAMLAHSVMSTERRPGRRAHALVRPPSEAKNSEKIMAGLGRVLAGLGHGDEAECPPRLATQVARSCVDEYRARLRREIVRNFGSELQELTRSGSDHFSMSLKAGRRRIMSYRSGRLALDSMPKPRIALRLSNAAGAAGAFRFEWSGGWLRCEIGGDVADGLRAGGGLLPRFYARLKSAVLQQAVAGLPAHSSYFPAARSGILQAHRVIASNIAGNAPRAGIEDTRVPRLSGVLSDLASAITDMRPARGSHYDTGRRIESDIFGGHIKLGCADPGAIPEILCERSAAAVPVHGASSAVSELAPFTLHLKHRAEGHGVLIIEEPEAHLHPRSQNLLAGHIVRLVREGANIIITTHSSSLFESMSQYLRASRLRPEGRKNALGSEDLYLREDDVAPHLFKMDGDGGSVVEKIDLSAEDGIEQDAFVKEDRLLNEANLRIEENRD